MEKRIHISKNFSSAAKSYDNYAKVQTEVFSNLLKTVVSSNKIKAESVNSILDIGCATGKNTKSLAKTFSKAKIWGLDLSNRMIEHARTKNALKRVIFECQNIEEIVLKEKFDLIFSNATFQWLTDFESAIKKLKNNLKKNGVLAFSFFGPKTFQELQGSIKSTISQNSKLTSSSFSTKETVQKILINNFKNVEVKEEILRREYSSLKKLLASIKYTGTAGKGIEGNIFWTPGLIKNLEKTYKQKYGQIIASYEIYYFLVN